MARENVFKRLKESDKYIIIYKRLSKEGNKGVALEQQEQDARDWLREKGLLDENKIIVLYDEITGKTRKRPGYQKMLQYLPMTKLIIALDVTRISRKKSELFSFDDLRKANNVEMYFTKMNVGSWDKTLYDFMMMIFSILAESEVEIISQRQKDSKNYTKNNGRGAWTGGSVPYGFVSKKIEEENTLGKVMKVPYLFDEKKELDVVLTIYKQYKKLRSIDKVAKYLEQYNFKDNRGKLFTRSKLTEIFRNPDYIIPSKKAYEYFKENGTQLNNDVKEWTSKNGIVCYNRYSYKPIDDAIIDKKHSLQSKDKWIISISQKHTGIVPFDLWLEVQNIMAENTSNLGRVHMSNQVSILNGIIYCRDCGEKMFPKYRNIYKNKKYNQDLYYHNGDRRFSYRCKNGMQSNTIDKCNNRSLIRGNEIDELVLNTIIDKFTIDKSELAKALEETSKGRFIGSTNSIIETSLNNLKDELANCIKQQEQYRLVLEKININTAPSVIDDYAKKLEKSLQDQQEIENKIEKTNLELKENYNLIQETNKIFDILNSIQKGFNNMNINEKKDCIKLLVKEVKLDREVVEITFIDDSVKNVLVPNMLGCKCNIDNMAQIRTKRFLYDLYDYCNISSVIIEHNIYKKKKKKTNS